MSLSDYINIGTSIIVSLGGSSVIIIGLSKWFGGVLANKLLEKDRLKYQAVLEKVKSSYEKELEKYKDQLEKQKALFLRYREYQFKLYNELWVSLSDLRLRADLLWQHADMNNLIAFSQQLFDTGMSVNRNRLLIEESHYNQLVKILYTFREYQVGKISLIQLRTANPLQESLQISSNDINNTIRDNQQNKQRYSELLEKLAVVFRKQITGD